MSEVKPRRKPKPRSGAEELLFRKGFDESTRRGRIRKALFGLDHGSSMAQEMFPDVHLPNQRRFLLAYVATGQRRFAASAIGIAYSNHPKWMDGTRDPTGQAAYVAAFAQAEMMIDEFIEDEIFRRGVEGVEKPILYKGRKVLVIKEYSDQLLMHLSKKRIAGYREDKLKVQVNLDDELTAALVAGRARAAAKRTATPVVADGTDIRKPD